MEAPLAARALRRELALLRRHPEQVFAVLDKWGLAGELEPPDGPRARWLRAPALEAGPDYELVCARARVAAIESSPLAVWLRSKDDGGFKWSPETGTVERAALPEVSRARTVELRGDGWGAREVVERSTGRVLGDVRVPAGGTVTNDLEQDGELVVTGCGDEYWDGYVHVYALPSMTLERALSWPTVVWSAHRAGRWVIGKADVRVVWDLETGEVVATFDDGNALTATDDGRWMVDQVRGLVRVWAWPSSIDTTIPRGFEPRFVAGGRRLIAGQELFDGERGDRIAELAFFRARPLEGGPPEGWLMEGGDHLVTCDIRYQAWNLETGEMLPDLGKNVRFPQWSRVALSPSGRFLAGYRVVNLGSVIVAVDRAEVVRELEVRSVERMRFLSDSELLVEKDDGSLCQVSIETGEVAPSDLETWPEPEKRGAAQGYQLRPALGALEIVGPDGEAVAHVTAETGLAAHPKRPIWAGWTAHFALE